MKTLKNFTRIGILLGFCWASFSSVGYAQCIPNANAQIDVNQVNATLQNGGDMFWDLVSNPGYEVPAGSGKNVSFASALWVGGMDNSGALHVSAATYRQNGNDYFAGPYRSNGNYACSGAFGQKWQKIWKVTRAQVMQFQADFFAGTVNFANYPDIETWPGNGDTTETEDAKLAPFVDRNGNGIYEPLSGGDYPCFPGDQGLWWVYNDDGTHTETNSQAFPLQVKNLAYAFDCQSGFCPDSVFDYLTFYHREITNKSSMTYTDVYIGVWVDADIGNYGDDYIGSDTVRNMMFAYNGDPDDETAVGYGLNPPAFGNLLLPNGQINKMKTSMSYGNDFSVTGNPETPAQYYNYMRAIWKNGTQLVDNGTDGFLGSGPGAVTNHIFPGDPGFCGGAGNGGWSEVSAGNNPFDRRFMQSYGPFTLLPGETIKLDNAMLYARGYYNDNLGSVCELKQTADIVLSNWNPSFVGGCSLGMPTASTSSTDDSFRFEVFPNPNNGAFQAKWSKPFKKGQNLRLVNLQGQIVQTIALPTGSMQMEIDATALPAGLYFLQFENGNQMQSTKIVVTH